MNFRIRYNNFEKKSLSQISEFDFFYFDLKEGMLIFKCTGKVPPGIQSMFVNRSLKLKFTVNILLKPRSHKI